MDKPETYKLITEDAEGITIALRHEWTKIYDIELAKLAHHEIIDSIITANGIYHILRDTSTESIMTPGRNNHKLLKYTTSEETGRVDMMMLDICEEEARQLQAHMLQMT